MAFLGSPLGWDGHLTMLQVDGVGLVTAFVALGFAAVTSGRRSAAAPAMAYGTYAILGAIATSVERSHFGLLQAASPRYTSLSVFLLIAVVFLLVDLRTSRWSSMLCFALLVVLIDEGVGVQRAAHATVLVFNANRLRELRGIAVGDPASAADADQPAGLLTRRLETLKQLDDGPIRYAK